MQRIIDRLLALARGEQLQTLGEMREIVHADPVEQTLASRADQMGRRKPRAQVRAGLDARMRGDPFLLRQAFGDLLDNAIEFSPEEATIEVRVQTAGGCQVVSVRDHGTWTPEFAMPHVFECICALLQTATGRKSTGLGLALVRGVAKVDGGRADFVNAPDGGAIAGIELPA